MKHLTNDELIDRLYGLEGPGHRCEACDARLAELGRIRLSLAPPADFSSEALAAQRRAIYARLGERPRSAASWAPATVAALCLAAAGIVVFHANPRQAIPVTAPHAVADVDSTSDAQLLSDVYSMEQSSEPLAAAPIHALIEEN